MQAEILWLEIVTQWFGNKNVPQKGFPFWNIGHQAILCDLFGMVKWPFQGLSDLQLGDEKGHFESPGMGFFFILSHISHGGF